MWRDSKWCKKNDGIGGKSHLLDIHNYLYLRYLPPRNMDLKQKRQVERQKRRDKLKREKTNIRKKSDVGPQVHTEIDDFFFFVVVVFGNYFKKMGFFFVFLVCVSFLKEKNVFPRPTALANLI